MHDVLVAGAGPAGLATAILAAQRGLDVVVVDPRPGVIDKACGEGLMPAGARLLHEMGVEIAEHRPFRGVRYVRGDQSAEGTFGGLTGMGIRRTVLHEAMLARADALGVRRVEGRVSDVVQHDDHVEAGGLQARWLVAADGLGSPVRRRLGLEQEGRWPSRYGLRRHYHVRPWTDMVEVHWADDAEAYVTPVADDLVGVAILYGSRCREGEVAASSKPFDRLLERFPTLRERLDGEADRDTRGAGPFGRTAKARVAGRVLLVGDAAGFMDPITGEGVKLAAQSAAAAIDCIVAGQPGAYERRWQQIWRPYAAATGALLTLTRPRWMRGQLVPFLRRFPWVFDRALQTLAA